MFFYDTKKTLSIKNPLHQCQLYTIGTKYEFVQRIDRQCSVLNEFYHSKATVLKMSWTCSNFKRRFAHSVFGSVIFFCCKANGKAAKIMHKRDIHYTKHVSNRYFKEH